MTPMRGARLVDLHDLITNAAFFIIALIAGAGAYLRRRPRPAPAVDPVVAGVGFGLMERQQAEQLIEQVKRCAVALEVLADRRTEEMEDIHKALLERLDAQERREEQEEPRPRPFRRRP